MSGSRRVWTSGSWCHVSRGMQKLVFVHFSRARVKQNALSGAVLHAEGQSDASACGQTHRYKIKACI